jgi:hypothetical protein
MPVFEFSESVRQLLLLDRSDIHKDSLSRSSTIDHLYIRSSPSCFVLIPLVPHNIAVKKQLDPRMTISGTW